MKGIERKGKNHARKMVISPVSKTSPKHFFLN
jgi:hypothetical protein